MKKIKLPNFKNIDKNKIKKYGLRSGTFLLVAAGALVGTYLLTPNKTRTIDLGGGSDIGQTDQPTESSYFSRFVNKLTEASSGNSADSYGLSATIDDLKISWPCKDGLSYNNISIDALIAFNMRNIDDIDFTIDLDAVYNNKSIDLGIGLVDSDFYFAFKDLKVKSSYTSTIEGITYVYDLFFNPENENGLGINFDLDNFINEKIGGLDLESLLGSFGDMALPETTETEDGDNVNIDLAMEGMNIKIVLDKETLGLKSVDLGTMSIGDVTIEGKIDCETIANYEVLKLDDENYPKQRGEFTEVISYIGWADKLLDFLKTRKIGLQLDASVTLDGEEGTESVLTNLASEINLNLSNLFDLSNINLGGQTVDGPIDGYSSKARKAQAIDTDKVEEILNSVEFGIDFSLEGQTEEEYANANVSYLDGAGYITLNSDAENNAVMKAKVETSTITSLINEIPDMVSSISNTSSKIRKAEAEQATEDIFSFITSSELLTAINNGDYSGIIDVIKSLTNDEKTISLTLDLSSLGLGNDAEVALVLDSTNEEDSKVIDLSISNVEIGEVNLDLNLSTNKYSDTKIEFIREHKDEYDDMSFLTGVVGQASNLLNTTEAKIDLNGSLFDENNNGVSIDGWAQFSLEDKLAIGKIGIRQYDDTLINSNKYIDHDLAFDINASGGSNAENNMYFTYKDNLKAKITVQTVTDIVDLVKDLINSKDERFTKFIDPIKNMLLQGALANVIANKDYLELAKNSYLKEIRQVDDGMAIRVTINGDALSMESDIVVKITFNENDGKKEIEAIKIVDLVISGKTLNLSIGLSDYSSETASPINKSDSFMDFSQVAVLLDFGINTTKLAHYHLTAKAKIVALSIIPVEFSLDFHIYVNGKTTKVYGSISDVPYILAVSNDLLTDVTSEFVFEPTDDIGGKFHIVRNEDHSYKKDEIYYYQSDSDNFVENILLYLLVDMLNVKSNAAEGLTNLTLDSEKDFDPDYSQLFNSKGFSYSEDGDNKQWVIGLNMAQLLGSNDFGDLDITLNGVANGNSGYFTTADVSMSLVKVVKITANITLDNPNPEETDWPSDIQAKYNKVLGWYYNLSDSDRAYFDANCLNNPLKEYRVAYYYF